MGFWLKRVGLFVLVNMLIVLTISVILSVFQIESNNIGSLVVFCLIWGMGGAFISLAISRMTAKWFMGVKVIPLDVREPELRHLLQMVHELSRAAQLTVMPEVGVYESAEINAFATGPSRSRSLVAVSTGLLRQMKSEEIKGVLAHEVTHIANGDMVTMTLIQGVVNAFVMFLARIIASALTRTQNQEGGRSSSPSFLYPLVVFLLEIIFMILGSMLVSWFSRHREYKADAGGARLAGRENMIKALESLRRNFESMGSHEEAPVQVSIRSLKISNREEGIMRILFSTHPPLEDRINRLKTLSR